MGGGDILPRGRLFPPPPLQANIDYVHRDEIGENVSSIPLKGFQKLQITRLFSIPFIITKNKRVHKGWGGTLYPGVDCPPLPQVNFDCVHRDEVGEKFPVFS